MAYEFSNSLQGSASVARVTASVRDEIQALLTKLQALRQRAADIEDRLFPSPKPTGPAVDAPPPVDLHETLTVAHNTADRTMEQLNSLATHLHG